jgi:GNAT superfamily N-acetyltransferase
LITVDPAFEIVRYQSAHKEQVLRLQQHLWGPDAALNRAFFEWKYEQNPYLTPPALCLALHRGEVVGMRGIFGAKWWIGTSRRALVIPYTDDFVIAPDHRDRGLASALLRATFAYADDLGYSFLLSLWAGRVTTLASLVAGYRSIGALEPVGRAGPQHAGFKRARHLLSKTRFVWRFANSPLLLAPSERMPFRRLDRTAGGAPSQGSRIRIERAPRLEAMAELADRLPPDDRIRQVHEPKYFDWVFRNPRLEFRYLFWESGGRLEGYLVLQRSLLLRGGPASVWVSDWEGTSDAILTDLLDTAVRHGRFGQLATWTATYPESVKATLTRFGFVPIDLERRARGQPAALIRPVRDADLDREWTLEGRPVMGLDNWRLRLLN